MTFKVFEINWGPARGPGARGELQPNSLELWDKAPGGSKVKWCEFTSVLTTKKYNLER